MVKVEIDEERYKELLDVERFMCALEAAGIDNWDGYAEAYEIMEEWDREE